MANDNNLVGLCTTGSLDALKNWMRLSLNRNLIFENYILPVRHFATILLYEIAFSRCVQPENKPKKMLFNSYERSHKYS